MIQKYTKKFNVKNLQAISLISKIDFKQKIKNQILVKMENEIEYRFVNEVMTQTIQV